MANLSASDLTGIRVRQARQKRGWTAKELAERCAKAGAPQITATVVTNLETRRRTSRQVAVDEWLALAHVLEVPPLQLLLPLEEGEVLEVVPGADMDAFEAVWWIGGPAVPPGVAEIRSTLSEGTAQLLRSTDPADVLTLLRQAGYLILVIGSEDRALTANPGSPGTAQRLSLMADRLMHVAARLDALGYAAPVEQAAEILGRRGLPVTLPQWRGQGTGEELS